jgi:hypothetical protein
VCGRPRGQECPGHTVFVLFGCVPVDGDRSALRLLLLRAKRISQTVLVEARRRQLAAVHRVLYDKRCGLSLGEHIVQRLLVLIVRNDRRDADGRRHAAVAVVGRDDEDVVAPVFGPSSFRSNQ